VTATTAPETTALERPAAVSRVRGAGLAFLGVILVAVNLRTAITGVGALLDEVRTGLGLSGTLAGVVTTLPTIAFAAFGATTPWLARRFSPARLLAVAMAALVAGQVLRVVTDAPALFIAFSALALAGIAVANILLPLVVKQHFPGRAGLVTGAYTVSISLGATVASATAVPVAHAFGSWRAGLGIWAAFAAVAVLPWLPEALRRTRRVAGRATTPALRVRPARTRLGWAIAVFFGMQSIGAYAVMGWLAQLFRDAGFTPQTAGLLLAAVPLFGVPFTLLIPTLAGRVRRLAPLMLGLTATAAVSYVGLAVAPRGGALLWVALLGIGQCVFPVSLAAIGLRTRTAEGTVALSAFAQSLGYLVAGLGPLLVGVLYEATGGWTAPIGLLLGALVVQAATAVLISRPRYVEDELNLPQPAAGSAASAATASSTVG